MIGWTWKKINGYDHIYYVSNMGEVVKQYKHKRKNLKPYRKCGRDYYVVKLMKNGRAVEIKVSNLVSDAFLGPRPSGYVTYHRNFCKSDNSAVNLTYITRKELGCKTGLESKRRSVVKINQAGEEVEIYKSAREAGRENYMSYQTIIDRCNGKVKSTYAPDGFKYVWEDGRRRKIE